MFFFCSKGFVVRFDFWRRFFFSFRKKVGYDWIDIGRKNKKEKSEKDSFPWFQNFIS